MPDNPLKFVQDWLFRLGDISSPAQFAEVAAADAGLVVVDFADYSGDETPLTPEQVDSLRGSDDTLIVSYLSIGEAEDYRFYWDTPAFNAIRDVVLDSENPEFDGNFKVRYWEPEWQDIIFDYVDRIIDGGFNGLYLDIIDGFEYWEEEDPNSGIDYRQEMADFVAAIRAHAEERLAEVDPDRIFAIIGQNGEELLENETYLAAIDGVGKEDLQFYYEATNESGFTVQDQDAVSYSLNLLLLAEAEGKQVFAVEYLSSARQAQFTDKLAEIAATLAEAGIPIYVAEHRNLDDVYTQPDAVMIAKADPMTLRGTSAGEVLRGGAGDDMIEAQGGNDQIWAGAGDAGADIVIGGPGNDTIGGGPGADFLIGDAASDGSTAHIEAISPNVSADDLAASGADVVFGGTGNDTLLGGGWDDSLISDNGRYDEGEALVQGTSANAIWAGGGRDVVIGAAGADTLGGGAGDDCIMGAAGNDLIYGGRDAGDIGFNDTLDGGAGDDTIFGAAGVDVVRGGSGDDLLFNGAGNDTVDGGADNDTLWGGGGDDMIIGGAGADTFAFGLANGVDTVTDFDPAEDILNLAGVAAGFVDSAAVQAAASATVIGDLSGVLIDTGDGAGVFLAGLTLDDLSAIMVVISA